MLKCKSHARVLASGALMLCLSACHAQGVHPGANKPNLSSSQMVVMMDPKIDDAMLPAIGEGLSRGQVTIYPLEGPAQVTGVTGDTSGPMMPRGMAQGRIMLTPPLTNNSSTSDDGQVTIYSMDSGEPVMPRPVPMLSPPPLLPPYEPTAKKLPSPFKSDSAPVTTKKSPQKTAVKPKAAADAAPAPAKKRPPRGMTY